MARARACEGAIARSYRTQAAAKKLQARERRARALHAETPLIDGHNDLPWAIRQDREFGGDPDRYDLTRPTPGHTDLARLRAGGIGGQFWSVYVPAEIGGGYARMQLEQLDLPSSLYSLILSRIDQLSENQKTIASALSVRPIWRMVMVTAAIPAGTPSKRKAPSLAGCGDSWPFGMLLPLIIGCQRRAALGREYIELRPL